MKTLIAFLLVLAAAIASAEESYWVKKKPSSDTLTVRRVSIANEPDPQNWERMTVAQIAAYEAAEKAAGWVPVHTVEALPVPTSVSRRALLIALFRATGKKEADVLAFISQLPTEAARYEASIEFQAATFERTHPLVAALAQAFALTSAQVDDIFRAAANL